MGHAVGLASGTAGLHLALHALGVGPGDDVLVSTFTFVATANAVLYTGARPVFVDCEPSSWCIDPDLLLEELADRRRRGTLPKAVVAVDLYGQCADYDRFVDTCRELGVAVVEDAAEAIGATYHGRRAGSLGDIGVLSFNGNKLITTSGGGAVVVDDAERAARIRYLATQARQPVEHYEHTELGSTTASATCSPRSGEHSWPRSTRASPTGTPHGPGTRSSSPASPVSP